MADKETAAVVSPTPVPPRTVTIQGTEVLIDPVTNRPMAGSIVGAGGPGARKIAWTERDLLDKFPMVDWFNYGDLRSVKYNGVPIPFGFGQVRTVSIARDMAYEAYAARGLTDAWLRSQGVSIATGQLEPRRA